MFSSHVNDVSIGSATGSTKPGLEMDFNPWPLGTARKFPHVSSDLDHEVVCNTVVPSFIFMSTSCNEAVFWC